MMGTRQVVAVAWTIFSFLLISQIVYATNVPLAASLKTLSTAQQGALHFGTISVDGVKKSANYAIFEDMPQHEENSTGGPKATIAVRNCTEEKIGNRVLPVVGGGCREYDVNVTPDNIEYNLVVTFADGSTKVFPGKGDRTFTVRWSIHAPVPSQEGAPSIANPPVCAKVVYKGTTIGGTCNRMPARGTEANVEVYVKSPYPYNYTIEGNRLLLRIFVNYVARNGCEGVRASVKPQRCQNCYTVDVQYIKPAPGQMCTQVIRMIKYVTAEMKIDRNVPVHITVVNAQGPEKAGTPPKCPEIEGKLLRIKSELANCGENCTPQKRKELTEELKQVMKDAKDANCQMMPEPTISPKPVPLPQPIPPSKILRGEPGTKTQNETTKSPVKHGQKGSQGKTAPGEKKATPPTTPAPIVRPIVHIVDVIRSVIKHLFSIW